MFAVPRWRRLQGTRWAVHSCPFLLCRHTPTTFLLQGGSQLPYPDPGYWALHDRGPNLSAKLRVSEMDSSKTAPAIFLQCAAGQCKGGPRFECEDGYTGNLCSSCQSGRLYWRGTCGTKCAELHAPALVNILGIIAVVTVWLGLNKLTAGQYVFPCEPVSLKASLVCVY